MMNKMANNPVNMDNKKRSVIGRFASRVSISLENRLTNRPRGVVSKNDIGALKIDLFKRLWNTLEEDTVAKAREKDNNKTPVAEKKSS